MIEIKNLTKKYDEHIIFDNFSYTFNNPATVIMGKSGIGKSTLLKIISGLDGKYTGELQNGCKKTAYMFQEPRLMPWKNAIENVKVVLSKDSMDLAQKYFESVGLSITEDGNKYPDELSGGQKQRVALARFLAYAHSTEADCLILDEPFSSLDEETLHKVISLVKNFAEGKILIISCHDRSVADMLGAKILEIK